MSAVVKSDAKRLQKQRQPTRADRQRASNDRYARGEISRDQWSREFDELSRPLAHG
jgi:uncharacterized membrane protein